MQQSGAIRIAPLLAARLLNLQEFARGAYRFREAVRFARNCHA
jgi:hypothetical protein